MLYKLCFTYFISLLSSGLTSFVLTSRLKFGHQQLSIFSWKSFPHLSFLCLFKCINIILCYAPLFLNLKIHRSVIFLYFVREDHDDVLSQDVCRNDGYHQR